MRYVSTRGQADRLGFEDVLTTGLARDGGLYVPETWPRIDRHGLAALAYEEAAARVLSPFIDETFAPAELAELLRAAYAGFSDRGIAPLVEIGPDLWLMELFHGPTLAFKDVAMQVLAQMFARVLDRSSRRAVIIGATSGDTGSAAISAFAGLDAVDVFILYPQGRISEVQRRQMTTVEAGNVHALAIEGNFDDCQALVKAMFNDHRFRDEMGLAGVNSINWARILPQTVYYLTSCAALGRSAVNFAVPTGNFGDVYAGYAAKAMGAAIGQLIVATNVNDILARTLASGRYETAAVIPTLSPSMDIQLASNFERLVFDLCGRRSDSLRAMMTELAQSGGFTLAPDQIDAARRDFSAVRIDEEETLATIARIRSESGRTIDPHSAVGVAAANCRRSEGLEGPIVCLATAHPAKFPDAVAKATGETPPLPPAFADLHQRNERVTRLPPALARIEDFITVNRRRS